MLCACHCEEMYWQKDARYGADGYWECGVKRRQWARDRYDNDPVYRITKRLHDDAMKRRRNLNRRRAALAAELQEEAGHHGPLSAKRLGRPALEPHPQAHHA